MADPTARKDIAYSDIDTGRGEYVIKDTEPLVVGGHCSIDETTKELEFSGENSHIPVGFVLGSLDGNNTNLLGNAGGTNIAVTRGNIDVEVDVVGVAAITDVNKQVFATDGQTFSLTNPGTLLPAGLVKKHISGTKCIVHFFSLEESYFKV